jgi:hypothetical protein
MTLGMKNVGGFGESDMLAIKELAKRGVISHADDAAGQLERKVEIANEPAEPGAFQRGGKRYLKDRFRLLRDDISGVSIMEECDAIVQRLVEIKAEFAPILGGGAPPAFRKRMTIRREQNFENTRGNGWEWCADEVHGKIRTSNLPCLKQKIPLRQRQDSRGIAAEFPAIGLYGVCLWIDLDLRQCVVPKQVALGDLAGI